MDKGKEDPHYRYPNSLILLCCSRHRTCVSTSIPSITGGLFENDVVNLHKETQVVSTRFHNNLVKERRERMRKNLDRNINSEKTT